MLISPDRKCKCGNMFWDLIENSTDQICIKCGHRETLLPLEDICPGITAKIIKAQSDEVVGETQNVCKQLIIPTIFIAFDLESLLRRLKCIDGNTYILYLDSAYHMEYVWQKYCKRVLNK